MITALKQSKGRHGGGGDTFASGDKDCNGSVLQLFESIVEDGMVQIARSEHQLEQSFVKQLHSAKANEKTYADASGTVGASPLSPSPPSPSECEDG